MKGIHREQYPQVEIDSLVRVSWFTPDELPDRPIQTYREGRLILSTSDATHYIRANVSGRSDLWVSGDHAIVEINEHNLNVFISRHVLGEGRLRVVDNVLKELRTDDPHARIEVRTNVDDLKNKITSIIAHVDKWTLMSKVPTVVDGHSIWYEVVGVTVGHNPTRLVNELRASGEYSRKRLSLPHNQTPAPDYISVGPALKGTIMEPESKNSGSKDAEQQKTASGPLAGDPAVDPKAAEEQAKSEDKNPPAAASKA